MCLQVHIFSRHHHNQSSTTDVLPDELRLVNDVTVVRLCRRHRDAQILRRPDFVVKRPDDNDGISRLGLQAEDERVLQEEPRKVQAVLPAAPGLPQLQKDVGNYSSSGGDSKDPGGWVLAHSVYWTANHCDSEDNDLHILDPS